MFFFFFKQKTAYEMSIGDWSSDVCSSDLALLGVTQVGLLGLAHQEQRHCKDRERPEVRRLVAEEDDAGDESIDEVMRDEPREALVERPPPALVSLDRSGEADEDRKSTRLNSSHQSTSRMPSSA